MTHASKGLQVVVNERGISLCNRVIEKKKVYRIEKVACQPNNSIMGRTVCVAQCYNFNKYGNPSLSLYSLVIA